MSSNSIAKVLRFFAHSSLIVPSRYIHGPNYKYKSHFVIVNVSSQVHISPHHQNFRSLGAGFSQSRSCSIFSVLNKRWPHDPISHRAPDGLRSSYLQARFRSSRWTQNILHINENFELGFNMIHLYSHKNRQNQKYFRKFESRWPSS